MKRSREFLSTLFFHGCVIFSLSAGWALGVTRRPVIEGPDALTGREVTVSGERKKGLVVVFASAACPCTKGHLSEMASLANDYPDFAFAVVHSNSNEGKLETRDTFNAAKLSFPVIQDSHAKLADDFKANKTPYAVVIKSDGEIAYRGGISDSCKAENANHKFLREALGDLSDPKANGVVRNAETRSVGCAIVRGEKSDW